MDENRDILDEQDKGVNEAKGALAFLFRKILFDRNITPIGWARMMNRFLDDPRNGIPPNGKDRSSARGNLNKELRRPRMTWKVFEKAMRFLGLHGLRFEAHLRWPGATTPSGIVVPGKVTKHGVNIALVPGVDDEGAKDDVDAEDENQSDDDE